MSAVADRELSQVRLQRSVGYELAALVRIAYHDPSAFPSLAKLLNEEEARPAGEDLYAYLEALSVGAGGSTPNKRK